jgi:two-component system sensor histidine kinase VicK
MVDINSILHSIIKRLSPHAEAKEITVSHSFKKLKKAVGDGGRLMQAFSNLVDNAIKFTYKGGLVTIKSQQIGNWILVSVKDNGRGVAEEDRENIFNRFFQVENSRADFQGRSSGLGLSIAQEIIKAHGGTITVDSKIGRGSEFMVKIPISLDDEVEISL